MTVDRVGAVAGRDLILNALKSVLVAAVLMLAYIALRFDFYSGLAAVIGLVHDVLIMVAVMVFLRAFVQVNTTFIAAMLTIVGYSINNTIVIFDRIRENVKGGALRNHTRAEVVVLSTRECFTRTVSTALTTLLTTVTLFVLGVSSIREFTLPLIVGIVSGGRLHIGDNSCVETFCLRNSVYPDMISEATVSAGGIRREYARLSGIDDPSLETKDIYDIADGIRSGNREAALKAFEIFGMAAGDAIATAASLIDGIVVLGGGVARGNKFFMSALLGQMRSKLRNYNGEELSRVQPQVYNLDDEAEFALFARGGAQKLQVYGSERMVDYDPQKRIGVTVSRIGSSRAIQLGAAAYALNRIDGK